MLPSDRGGEAFPVWDTRPVDEVNLLSVHRPAEGLGTIRGTTRECRASLAFEDCSYQ